MTFDDYLHATKRAILATYCNDNYAVVSPDQFVDTLNRVFTLKKKVLANIARYVQNEVEGRGKTLDATLANISFFSAVLVEYIDRDGNQPISK